MHIYAEEAKLKVVAIIYNKDGQPQFDDFNNIPKEFEPSLTEKDWEYINSRRAK